MNTIKISVIIPVYNTSVFLSRCLDSILEQDYDNFEVICINDGSTDSSESILESYAQRYHNLIIVNQSNMGVSVARNSGLNCANGEYVVFVDSDDYVANNYLTTLAKLAIENDYDLVCSGIHDFNSDGIINTIKLNNREYSLSSVNSLIEFLETRLNTSPVSKLYKKSIIENFNIQFNPKLSLGEDRDFNLHFFNYCNKLRISDYIGYYYRKDVLGSLTHQLHKGILLSNYNAIIQKQIIFITKDLFDNIAKEYTNRGILQLLFDELTYIARLNETQKDMTEFKEVISLIGDDWKPITKNINDLKIGFVFKYLFVRKQFKSLVFILTLINKLRNLVIVKS